MSTQAEREAFQQAVRQFVLSHGAHMNTWRFAYEAGELAVEVLGVGADDVDGEADGYGAVLASGAFDARRRLRGDKQREEWRERHARLCRQCGNEYMPTRRDSRYCSGKCRVAAHRARVTAAPPATNGDVTP